MTELTFPTAPQLPAEVLVRQQTLPRKPDPVTLTGRYFQLRPLILEQDAEPLYRVSNGDALTIGERHTDAYDAGKIIWQYMFGGPFANAEAMTAYLRPQVEAANGLCLCVIDLSTGAQVGVLNYMNNFPEHLKVELGSIWYSPLVQRTQANLECTYLALKHAFELGYRRVEWKCDSLNERSRRSALRMGFTFEGIQDAHFIIKGRNRDTAWFRILDTEWDEVRAKLETMLGY